MKRTRWILAIVMTAALGRSGVAGPGDRIDELMAFVPAEAEAVVIVPSLKGLSERTEQCLKGMDRAQLLMGARPIDVALSLIGVMLIDDTRGACVALLPRDPARRTTRMVAVIPVTDAARFVEALWTPTDEPGRYRDADGNDLWVEAHPHHVIVSRADPLDDLPRLGRHAAVAWREGMLDRDGPRIAAADALAWCRGRAGAMNLAVELRGAVGVTPLDGLLESVPEGFTDGLFTLDVDALAVTVAATLRAAPDSDLGRAMAGGSAAGGRLTTLPRDRYLVSGSADLAGIGGVEARRTIADAVGVAWLADLVVGAGVVDAALYRRAGPPVDTAPIDGLAVIRSAKPGDLPLLATGDRTVMVGPFPIRLEVSMPPPAEEGDRAIMVRADQDASMAGRLAAALLGEAAEHAGAVDLAADRAIVTFGPRRTLLDRAAGASTASLATDSTVTVMRTLLPAGCDVEMYLDLSRLGALWSILPGPARNGPPPGVRDGLPPIGAAVEIQDHAATAAIVLPTDVLTVLFDETRRLMTLVGENAP